MSASVIEFELDVVTYGGLVFFHVQENATRYQLCYHIIL